MSCPACNAAASDISVVLATPKAACPDHEEEKLKDAGQRCSHIGRDNSPS